MLKNITPTKDVYGLCNSIRIKICVICEIRGLHKIFINQVNIS